MQALSGNSNLDSIGTNTLTYKTISAPTPTTRTPTSTPADTSAACSNMLKKLTTSKPTSSSLSGKTLCKKGTPSRVTYDASGLKWTYQCRATDGSTADCTVAATLSSAPACTPKSVEEPLYDQCSLTNTSNVFSFYKYLDCLGIAEKSSCASSGCPQEAKRQELVYLAARLRSIPLETGYQCQKKYTDTSAKGVPSWVCEVAEKSG